MPLLHLRQQQLPQLKQVGSHSRGICKVGSGLIDDRDLFRVPIDKMIALLSQYFSPDRVEGPYSLSIVQGQDGARLTHSHERQYHFTLQSMTLWRCVPSRHRYRSASDDGASLVRRREIMDDMFRLWCLAEEDLILGDGQYELRDTGQGLHRVQLCPKTFHAMQVSQLV
jgi:hypothetical protein